MDDRINHTFKYESCGKKFIFSGVIKKENIEKVNKNVKVFAEEIEKLEGEK